MKCLMAGAEAIPSPFVLDVSPQGRRRRTRARHMDVADPGAGHDRRLGRHRADPDALTNRPALVDGKVLQLHRHAGRRLEAEQDVVGGSLQHGQQGALPGQDALGQEKAAGEGTAQPSPCEEILRGGALGPIAQVDDAQRSVRRPPIR